MQLTRVCPDFSYAPITIAGCRIAQRALAIAIYARMQLATKLETLPCRWNVAMHAAI